MDRLLYHARFRSCSARASWDLQDAVEADRSAVLRPGDCFAIADVRSPAGEPLVADEFEGKPVSLPLQREEFRVFLVRRR